MLQNKLIITQNKNCLSIQIITFMIRVQQDLANYVWTLCYVVVLNLTFNTKLHPNQL